MSKGSSKDTSAPEAVGIGAKIKEALWPIHNDELKKFLPMGMMMFFILFNYTMLRDTKDSLIATAAGSGPEVIPFLKSWGVLPSAMLFVVIYAKLANVMSREKLFYTIVTPFLIFFTVFAFYLYPNRELIHPSIETVQYLKDAYPNFQWLFPIYGLWTYSLFYICSELWGSVMISLLFWQFANEITRTKEAKRFYSMFGLLANFSLMASGMTVRYFSDIRSTLPPEVDAWGVSLNYMMSAVAIAGVLTMIIYRWMNTNVLTDPRYYDAAADTGKKKKPKAKLSVGESFKYLMQSKYLGYIAILVIAYGMSMQMTELLWKKQLQLQFPDPNDYNKFMGAFSASTGLATIILILMLKGMVRRFGWFVGAIITPVMIMVTGVMFFSFVLFKETVSPMIAALGTTPLMLAVLIGAAQNILSKGTKYSVFDPTKEMAYIPLDEELKVKGKAAVDVVGGRLGKAGGGYVSQILLIITGGTALDIGGYLAVIVIGVIFAWMIAVKSLSRLYNAKIKEQGIET